MSYSARFVNPPNTLEHRVYLEIDGKPASFFHDVPLYANAEKTVLNMIVEISKDDFLNPIKQDVKKGKLRFVRNCFPHKGYIWNYGAFPQTWEDPHHVHPDTRAKGDNDPLDVCEIGELVGTPGQIKQVKVLGCMALLDEGETDWKVIAIDVNDPLASKLNGKSALCHYIEDVERLLPGLLRATNEWFRIYKIPDGKPENKFAFNGEAKNKKYVTDVIEETHEAWKKLISGKSESEIARASTSVHDSPFHVKAGDAQLQAVSAATDHAPAKIDSSVDKWFYISGSSA
ncbi:Inorganic pyrophosphatase [Sorochytrium milnesiophthora]